MLTELTLRAISKPANHSSDTTFSDIDILYAHKVSRFLSQLPQVLTINARSLHFQ